MKNQIMRWRRMFAARIPLSEFDDIDFSNFDLVGKQLLDKVGDPKEFAGFLGVNPPSTAELVRGGGYWSFCFKTEEQASDFLSHTKLTGYVKEGVIPEQYYNEAK